MPNPTRNGKIASLPARIREALCRRLHDGERAPQLLPWLNGLPEVLTILDERFGEEPITPQNLSEWRQGGYQDWLGRIEKVEQTKILSAYCAELAAANPGGSNLPAAVAGGQLLSVLEDFDPNTLKALLAEKPGTYIELLLAMAKLQDARSKERVAEQNDRRLEQNERKLAQAQRALELAEQRFRRQTAELFLQFYKEKAAKEIVEGGGPKEVQMDLLMDLMFGKAPGSSTPSTPSGASTTP